MKFKFTFLIALLACTPLSAQVPAKLGSAPQRDKAGTPFTRVARNKAAKFSPVTTIPVIDQPEGQFAYAARTDSCYYFMSAYNYLGLDNVPGKVVNMVFQGDSVMWLHKPVSQMNGTVGWIRIDHVSGDQWECRLPQALTYGKMSDGVLHTLYATAMTEKRTQEGYADECSLNSSQTIKFTYKNGVITQNVQSYSQSIGLTDSTGAWLGYGDYKIKLVPNFETPEKKPDGLSREKWQWTSDVSSTNRFDNMVALEQDGDTVWFCCPADNDLWFKGVVKGNKVVFPTRQYLGLSESYGRLIYFYPCKTTWKQDGTYTVSLNTTGLECDYDAEAGIITFPSTMGGIFSINGGSDLFIGLYPNMVLKRFTEKPAVPTHPGFFDYKDYMSTYNFNVVSFILNPHDVDGNFIDPNNMAYQIYVDNPEEPFILDSIDYQIQGEMTDVPYYFTDNYAIVPQTETARMVYLFTDVSDSIGFRQIYTVDDVRNESAILWYNVKTQTTSVTGIRSITHTEVLPRRQEIYDVSGRRLGAMRKGLNIVRKADGSVTKVIR